MRQRKNGRKYGNGSKFQQKIGLLKTNNIKP